jgi:hypothetical protein
MTMVCTLAVIGTGMLGCMLGVFIMAAFNAARNSDNVHH